MERKKHQHAKKAPKQKWLKVPFLLALRLQTGNGTDQLSWGGGVGECRNVTGGKSTMPLTRKESFIFGMGGLQRPFFWKAAEEVGAKWQSCVDSISRVFLIYWLTSNLHIYWDGLQRHWTSCCSAAADLPCAAWFSFNGLFPLFQAFFCCDKGWTARLIHVSIGALCFAATTITMFCTESKLVHFVRSQFLSQYMKKGTWNARGQNNSCVWLQVLRVVFFLHRSAWKKVSTWVCWRRW